MNTAELRSKTTQELRTELHAVGEELFKLRMLRSSGQEPKPHLFGQAKRQIARIKTVLREHTQKEGK